MPDNAQDDSELSVCATIVCETPMGNVASGIPDDAQGMTPFKTRKQTKHHSEKLRSHGNFPWRRTQVLSDQHVVLSMLCYQADNMRSSLLHSPYKMTSSKPKMGDNSLASELHKSSPVKLVLDTTLLAAAHNLVQRGPRTDLVQLSQTWHIVIHTTPAPVMVRLSNSKPVSTFLTSVCKLLTSF